MMLYYELKKIWVKRSTKIALLLLAGVLALVCYLSADVYYVNENGDTEYGVAAIGKLKAAKKEWAGLLTEEVIADIIEENIRINGTPEGSSEDVKMSNIAYGWKQGFTDIRYLLMCSYCKFQEADVYRPDSLVPEDAATFYENRILHLKEWLDADEQHYRLSEEEKAFLLNRYETLETPFQYDYEEGFKKAFEYSAMVIMLTTLILGFMAAGIFSGEFGNKADAVLYASYHGRKRAVAAKLWAGLLWITILYFAIMLLYSFFVFGYLGADGAGSPIQIRQWKSFYHLTNLQEYLLIVFGGYVGMLFSMLLTMLVSAKTKSTALAATIPFIIIFLPSFIFSDALADIWMKVVGLLPDRLLDMNQSISLFSLYSIGGRVVGGIGILFVLYGAVSILLGPLIYQIYRKASAG